MLQRIQAKMDAKDQLRGRWGEAIGAFLLIQIVMVGIGAASIIPYVGWLIPILLGGVGMLGMAIYSLKYTYNQEASIADMFAGFEQIMRAFCLYIIMGIFVLLWSLLFLIPGIIKSLSYSMSYYILAENPEMTAMKALNKSKEITQGHKWDLFVTLLSFMGWGLLATISCGIGYLWLVPYMNITMANIYNQIKE